ncbi:hypothetical protein BSAF29S_02189 [Bacillus safensis subsp. safensis]
MAAKMVQEEHSERDILEHLEETEGLKKPNGCVVMLFQKHHQIEEIAGNLYFLVSCRSIFQRAGFHLIPYEHQGQTLFILLNTRKKGTGKSVQRRRQLTSNNCMIGSSPAEL